MAVCSSILVSDLVEKQNSTLYCRAGQGRNSLDSKYVLFWRVQFQKVQVGTFYEKGENLRQKGVGIKK